MSAPEGVWQSYSQTVTFRTPEGLLWTFTGKKGRVLFMLASGQGVTQLDCYPWHTRLGGTIHALREAGLMIETQIEGPFRHARYFLRTEGWVFISPIGTDADRKRAA